MTTVLSAVSNEPIDLKSLSGLTVLFSVPAAFSGTCTKECVPGVVEHTNELKAAGASHIVVVASDQPHAIAAWVEAEGWQDSGIEFASDYGSSQIREIVGKLSDEEGKMDMPQGFGNLIRRGCIIYKDGEMVWKFVEEDSGVVTLNFADVVAQLQQA